MLAHISNRITLMILFILIKLVALGQSASSITHKQISKIDSLMDAYHRLGRFNGLILIASGDKIVYSKGFGTANREENIANTSTSPFYILSLTKLFTSALVLKLVEEGKVKLEAPFMGYLPKYHNKAWPGITINHLLTQTSGLPNYNVHLEQMDTTGRQSRSYSPDTLIQVIKDRPLSFKSGQKFEYNNTNHVLLGLIVEAVTGKSYNDALAQYITVPLKLTHTGYSPKVSSQTNFIRGYTHKGQSWSAPFIFNPSLVYSAGGMFSTLNDLLRFQRALDQGKLLQPEMVKKMHQPHIPVEEFYFSVFKEYKGTSYGYGVFLKKLPLSNNRTTPQIMIVGAIPETFFVHAVRFPEKEIYIITMENSGTYFFPTDIIALFTENMEGKKSVK
jgi:CubicO group peptidase (beta-lactamase class C family)